MSKNLRLWTPYPLEGFATIFVEDPEQEKCNDYQSIRKRSLIAEWTPLALEWYRSRKSDKLGDIGCLYGLYGLCLRRADLDSLFPDKRASFEFLPMRLGDEEWTVLNCLRDALAIDRASSDLRIPKFPDLPELRGVEPWIDDIRWINVVEPQVLAERWEALCVPASTDPMASRHLLLTDVFVDRFHNLGLRGIDFKHVGYIVADPSQAVPKPPAPLPPPPKPSKRKPPKLTSGPLPAEEQIEIAAAGAKWRQRVQLPSDASPEMTLQRLTEELRRLRPMFGTIGAEERIDVSLGLSAIYGELLRSACGWSWAELHQSRSKRWIAMLAPLGTHALALLPYMQQQIQSEAPTLTLLFNMIVAGQLPPAEPGQLASIV